MFSSIPGGPGSPCDPSKSSEPVDLSLPSEARALPAPRPGHGEPDRHARPSPLTRDLDAASIAMGELEAVAHRAIPELAAPLRRRLALLRKRAARSRDWLARSAVEPHPFAALSVRRLKAHVTALLSLSGYVWPYTLAAHLRRSEALARRGWEARSALPAHLLLGPEIHRYTDARNRLDAVDDPMQFHDATAAVEAAIEDLERMARPRPWPRPVPPLRNP